MCRFVILLAGLGLLLAGGAGCAAVGTQRGPSARWIARQGGLVHDGRQARLQGVAGPLVKCVQSGHLKMHVLNSGQPVAFSWPDGQVFVAAGLMDGLADDELAAVVAHEMGHLLNDGELGAPAALVGGGGGGWQSGGDAETRADAMGCRLLTACGVPREAMLRLLRKVRAGVGGCGCAGSIEQRIAQLARQE